MLNEKFTIVDFVKFYCNIKIEYKPNHRKYVMPAVFLLVCVLCITSINILLVFPKAYSL